VKIANKKPMRVAFKL